MENNTFGDCRCCLAKGNHHLVSQEFTILGGRETYIEMFMDCFNLFLSTDASVSQLICNNCITRLRDASCFRAMVASTEEQLLKKAKKKLIGTQGTDAHVSVFVQVPQVEEMTDVVIKPDIDVEIKREVQSDEDMFNSDYEDDFEEESKPDHIPGESELLSRFAANLKPLMTRQNLYRILPEYVTQLEVLKNMVVTSKEVSSMKFHRKHAAHAESIYVSEKLAIMSNVNNVLEYSNVTPFRSRYRTGFPCFYCRKIFEDFSKLREHSSFHKSGEILRVLKQSGIESMVVYAEISNLTCTLCNTSIPNLNELKSHLTKMHHKKIYTEVSDRVIPFKITEGKTECQICGCSFETFGSVERHMNGHYRNYVCKDCGAGFVTKYRLKVHSRSMHVEGNHPCEVCGKTFSTSQKLKNHVNAVHKMLKRFKCAKCPQRFTEYFRRQRHMEEIHGLTPLKYKCNVCDRDFDRRYTLSRHLKRDHLEERDYQCEICAYKCFTKNELRVHMVKHNGERIFECSVCKKSYARKKTLKEHMRIHNNDRRFACGICGQAFVQKCSLKGHLKTHHIEYSVQ